MRHKISVTLAAALALAASSCDESYTPVEDKTGQVDLSGLSVQVQDDPLVVESRSSAPEVSQFTATVTTDGGAQVGQWTLADMPGTLTLPEGRYTVTVSSHQLAPAEWERPYFEGSKTFAITGGETTHVGEVVCRFASVKVTVTFSDELLRRVDEGASVNVSTTGDASLDFATGEGRAGYFAPTATLVATFRGSVKGTPVEFSRVFGDVSAGQHRIINFSVKTGEGVLPGQTGTVDVQAWIDAEMRHEAVDADVALEEEILPDVPVTPGQHTITFQSSTIDLDGENGVDGDTYTVTICADAGVAHLEVAIGTDNDNFRAAVSDLLPLRFDLAYPAGRDEDFKSLGLPVGDQVLGRTSIDVDISQFVPLLSAYPGRHTFTVAVADMAGNSAQRVLTFVSR